METIKRFRKNIKKRRVGCWTWKTPTSRGYGRLANDDGEKVKAFNFSYNYYIGNIPPYQKVTQVCGDLNCVNPDHLILINRSIQELKTIQARRMDEAAKFYAMGRTEEYHDEEPEIKTEQEILRATARKERYSQKLTADDVEYIRSQPYNESLVSMAKKYRVCTGTISDVLTEKLMGDI
jgi:hypothetical protein